MLVKLRRLIALAAAVLVAGGPAHAAPEDAVMNKEGFWGIDVDGGGCAASMTLQGGSVFLLRAVDGNVTFGLFSRMALPRGKTGRIETEAYGVDFEPSYGEDATTLYYKGDLDARALAALRLARQVRVLTDGRMVASMTFEGTGFESALDGVTACSKGESGWWGKGAGAEPAVAEHKDGLWRMMADNEHGICTALVAVDETYAFALIAGGGQIGFSVVGDEPFKRGRKGRFETDKYSFDFKPAYDGDVLLSEKSLDSQAQFALRRAKTALISIDGKTVVDMALEGSGHDQIMDDVAACARGETGWWGDGLKAG